MAELSYQLAWPEIFMACSGLVLLMVGVFRREEKIGLVAALGLVALAVTAFLVWQGMDQDRALAFGGQFVRDPFAGFAKLLSLVSAFVCLFLSKPFVEREGMSRFELPVLMLFSVLGMMMMISANNLISLYVGLELQSLALYVLAALRRDSLKATEAGLKYFVLGALSSGMLLYGASMIYGFTGTLSFDSLAQFLKANEVSGQIGLLIGLVFLIAGLAFKISAVPFHMWTPDVYEGAPTPIVAFFAAAPKVAALALLCRVLIGPFGWMADEWRQIIIFLSIASMLLGAVAAVGQNNIKRLMGYSSIGNMGYALIGLAAGTPQGIGAVLFYLCIYIVMTIGTFGVILSMRRQDGMAEEISDLAGLARTKPWMAHMMAIFMFSMAGIPPLAGFFTKYFIFFSAIEAQLYGLAIIGVISSVISAFYYLRIVKVMYFDEPAGHFQPADRSAIWVTSICAVAILFFLVVPEGLIDKARAVAETLFIG